MDLDTKFDNIIKEELEKRLKRPALPHELINSDTDSDLVNEVLWQLVKDLEARVRILEKKP